MERGVSVTPACPRPELTKKGPSWKDSHHVWSTDNTPGTGLHTFCVASGLSFVHMTSVRAVVIPSDR